MYVGRLENWPGTADQAIENPVSDKVSSEWKCTVAIYPEDVRGGGEAVLQKRPSKCWSAPKK